ncbi:hypothetical protein RI845_03205 [Thalassotalea nanhaiensis]|uniref:CBM-cenC domain-containing protein n=1 Tax=Thalassotalea nanhaiensis TaxID=3065648 RepID=A0ABY9TK22_9GAMM|nr:hypothetical protein RI845_03205 [Colwelliaceae bacterium SQ345]
MSKLLKTKVATAVAATLIFASAPSLAENLTSEGTLEGLTGFNAGGNLAFNVGPMLSDGTTQAWGQIGPGWCRIINDTITSEKAGVTEHSPAGNNTNVAYCNHKRADDSGGIYRAVEGLESGKTYSVSAKGATRGSLQWAIEYTKQGEDVVTNTDLDNIVVSDLAWVTITDKFTVPADADLTKQFRVYIHTQPSDAHPETVILETPRSLMWVDDYEVMFLPDPVEYFSGGDLESVTGFGSGNSAWGNGPLLSDGTTAAYSVEVAGFKSGWCRFINKDRTQTAKPAAGSEAIPAGNDSEAVAFCNHNRNNDAAGIGRIVEEIQIGKTYELSGDAANKGSVRWAYSYVKTGEETRTVVQLTNEVVSDGAWVNVTDSFAVPADVDITKDFIVFIHTAPSVAYPATGDISVTPRSLLWTDNYSLMGPPSLADTDEDGTPDSSDAFPEDPAASVDTDGDGMPDDYNEDCDAACQEASDLVIDDDDDGDGILDVNDGYPTDASQSVMIAFATESSSVVEGEEVTIDASPSVPNSELATYTWAQDSGANVSLTPDGSMVTFTAPTNIAQQEEIVISLTVAGAAQTVSDTYNVSVTNAPAAITPTATMTGMLDSEGVVLAYGEKIQLDASASFDSEDGMLSFKWKVTGGVPLEFSDMSAADPTFYVPLVKADTPITIELTVTNYLRDYDGTYILDDNGDNIVASSNTFEIPATVKKTFPVVEYPLEYFFDGGMETVTGFITEGWGIGNYGFAEPNAIFTARVDDEGNKIQAIGQTAKGWSRYINETRTQPENGFDVRAPEGRTGVVAFMNHKRTNHLEGLYREVEGIVPGATYVFSADAAALGTVQLSYRYVKVDAPVVDDVAEVTTVELDATAESAYKWVTLTEEFVAPEDIDISHPFRVVVHTVGDASVNLNNSDDARLWMDNLSFQELPSGLDTDADGVIDIADGFPEDPSVAADTDGDGLPDSYVKTCEEACIANSDAILDDDDDNDGILDVNDGHPKNSKRTVLIKAPRTAIAAVESELITIDAGTSIPNADNATYTWSLVPETELQGKGVEGIVLEPSVNGGSVNIMAPEMLTEQADFEVMLTIDDGLESVSQTYSVTITNAPAVITPNATLSYLSDAGGMSLAGMELTAGEEVMLDASTSFDSEAGELSYAWRVRPGANETGSASVPITFNEVLGSPASTTFTIPEINIDNELVIEVTVSNYVRDYDGSYILDADGNKSEWTSETIQLSAMVAKTEQKSPDNGSFGFLAMLFFSTMTLARRLFNVK